jgi:uncharacterized protein
MLKFLLVVVVVVSLLAWLLGRSAPKRTEHRPRKPAPPRLEEMVVCAHCGVHLPQRDAVLRSDRHYCGLPHADAGPRDNPR